MRPVQALVGLIIPHLIHCISFFNKISLTAVRNRLFIKSDYNNAFYRGINKMDQTFQTTVNYFLGLWGILSENFGNKQSKNCFRI